MGRQNSILKIKIARNFKLKPIPYPQCKPFPLEVGADYFLSFGKHEVRRGKLIKVITASNDGSLWVKLDCGKNQYTIYADEIGRSPVEAILNEVTF